MMVFLLRVCRQLSRWVLRRRAYVPDYREIARLESAVGVPDEQGCRMSSGRFLSGWG